jgi:hypothetical protein
MLPKMPIMLCKAALHWNKTICSFPKTIKPLTPELKPLAQRCLARFFTGILLFELRISLIYA